VGHDQWLVKPNGSEDIPTAINIIGGGVLCECKQSCGHAADMGLLGLQPASPAPARAEQAKCAVLASQLMTACLSAAPDQLHGMSDAMQELISRLEPSVPVERVAPAIEDPERTIIPIQARKELGKYNKRKRKGAPPTKDQIASTLLSLQNDCRTKNKPSDIA
jgi:hypothetical protein